MLEAMAEAVEKAAVVLVCLTQKYKESPNCRTGECVQILPLCTHQIMYITYQWNFREAVADVPVKCNSITIQIC